MEDGDGGREVEGVIFAVPGNGVVLGEGERWRSVGACLPGR